MSPDVTTARRNLVLNDLDDDHLHTLLPFLKEQPLTLGDVLYHAGGPVTGVQFPTDGVVSIVTDVDAGHRVEVATVGRDGLVGLPLYLRSGAPTETATVQVPGTALHRTHHELGRLHPGHCPSRWPATKRDAPLHPGHVHLAGP